MRVDANVAALHVNSGKHNDYYWVEWHGALLRDLLARVPSIALNRYLVNTSFDSGSLCPSEEEKQQGWRTIRNLTYSPHITDVRSIPHDQFDEWLIFSEPTEVQSWEAVVNYGGLSLADSGFDWIHEKLWPQIQSLNPESYLAEGDWLIFITRSEQLFGFAMAQTDLETRSA